MKRAWLETLEVGASYANWLKTTDWTFGTAALGPFRVSPALEPLPVSPEKAPPSAISVR